MGKQDTACVDIDWNMDPKQFIFSTIWNLESNRRIFEKNKALNINRSNHPSKKKQNMARPYSYIRKKLLRDS